MCRVRFNAHKTNSNPLHLWSFLLNKYTVLFSGQPKSASGVRTFSLCWKPIGYFWLFILVDVSWAHSPISSSNIKNHLNQNELNSPSYKREAGNTKAIFKLISLRRKDNVMAKKNTSKTNNSLIKTETRNLRLSNMNLWWSQVLYHSFFSFVL